jgi:hypothetical protein
MSKNSIDLTKILIEKNLVGLGTNISAKISVSGFGYAPITREKYGKITAIGKNSVKAVFDDNQHLSAKFEEITSIEGMEISRFAQAYRIKLKTKKK